MQMGKRTKKKPLSYWRENASVPLKSYCDQKTLSSDFKTLFTKQSPREILGLNFEKKTVYLNFNFPIYWSAIITPERIQ